MNNATFAGNLGRDAEMRFVNGNQGDIAVCNFALAVTEMRGGNKTTLWVSCALWGKRAEALSQYLTKGSKVAVSGAVGVEQFTANGEQRAKLTLRVSEVTLQGAGQAQPGQQGQGQQNGQQQNNGQAYRDARNGAPPQQPPAGQYDDFDDNIPGW